MAFHRLEKLPEQFLKLQLLPDLSKHTLQLHSDLLTITKALCNHTILHHWKYPAKLTIMHNGMTKTILKLEEGLQLLCSWDITPDPPPHQSASADP